MDQISSFSKTVAARRLVLSALALLTCLVMSVPARAERVDDLMDALQVEAMLGIMRTEGMAYGEELAGDMLPGGSSAPWRDLLAQIYDSDSMRAVVRTGISQTIEDTDPKPLIAFFSSDLGQRIVQLELAAREAMIDDAVEEAAREAYREMKDDEDPRLDQLRRFVEVNDLLEANVTGALNASFQFYSGLVDGGGLQLSEGDILSDVWSQEDETREDTREWLFAYLLLAYEPLENEELDAYIALSETSQGRALNRALFAGFNAMYDEISYALGLAAAQQMQQQEL
ncbi:DUF2059 domain-containing protein [Antarctobacter heliothermus]|uniref:DUF2059 domain-containing protein n=1 Tax=Antarctobacter heliothermus TaxID=74033 RepID=A0A239L9V5_9RHOB|nr:DUF2059 domain-containing protein [Antarctobacter heliothermus]SNT27070.1 hypothetical protein SAMN04488078_108315 [Antarctobacter heliothermus]